MPRSGIDGSDFLYRVRQTDPMTVESPFATFSIECLVYNLSPFGFHGGPSNGCEELRLEIPDGWRAALGPLTSDWTADPSAWDLLGTPWRRPTHQLILTREDAGRSCQDVANTLFTLSSFLSFAWGRRIGFGLLQGWGENGEWSFVMPGVTRVDPLIRPVAHVPHWFPPSRAEMLADILPGFWMRSTDPDWKDSVEWGLYWWLSANRVGQASETSILASQAGLESIASAVLKLSGSPQRIADLNAAEKIRAMLDRMSMTNAVPEHLGSLRSVAASNGWDGPQALTRVRNALVHPEKGDQAGLAFESSQLSMWYLELGLLFLFGHRGRVCNRTVLSGAWFENDTVPWAR